MTPAQSVLRRIDQGPADIPDLAASIHKDCGIDEVQMYRIARETVDVLLREKKVYLHECGAYMQPIPVPGKTKATSSKLRPGTPIPKKYRHLLKGK